jgi:hypothetical protein
LNSRTARDLQTRPETQLNFGIQEPEQERVVVEFKNKKETVLCGEIQEPKEK